MLISRREFLKASLSAGCVSAWPGISSLSYAGVGDTNPLLVVLFLRGGADGLSLVAPSADPDYIAARPAELRVLDEGSDAILGNPLDNRSGFRFNPNAVSFSDLYKSNRLAVIHAIGILDATRSHFVAQEIIEKGINEERFLAGTDNGWLGRAISTSKGSINGYSATASTDLSLYGSKSVLSAPDLFGNFNMPGGQSTSDFLREVSEGARLPTRVATINTLNIIATVNRDQLREMGGRATSKTDNQQFRYDGSGELGRALGSVAKLSSMDVGLQCATLDHGGWDTHEAQAYRFTNQVKQLSIGLATFDEDMRSRNRRYNLIVMTEFGRRLQSNKSGGTDHGHGACWLALGDSVKGGRMYGKWPGLKNEALDHGVDLAVTTDYRAVLSESLIASGLNAENTFPGAPKLSVLKLYG